MALPLHAALADEGDIDVVAVEAESVFPDGIKFSITAKSSEEIDDIRIFFRKIGQTGRSAYRSVDFQPGTLITGESTLSSGGGSAYFPPGTRFLYSFEIRDKGGAVLRTDEQDYVYSDQRFEWLEVTSGLITVDYYGEFVEARANTVLKAAEDAMDRMVPVLKIEPTEPLRIVAYNNYRHMSAALPFRSQAVTEQLQTQGMAFTDERVLLVHAFDTTVKGTVSHEFTHLLVAEAAGSATAQVPAWLNEGLAEYGNVDPTDSYEGALRFGIFTRRLKPLWYQDSFGGKPEDIIIAYGQAQSVVNYMIGRYGPEQMAELFVTLRRTLDIDVALDEVYGFDQYGLDTEWRINVLGIDPLPPPGELERRLQSQDSDAETESDSPAPVQTPGVATPEPAATPLPEPTPTPKLTPVASIADDEGLSGSPGGCNAPSHGGSSPVSLGLGTLLLMSVPLGLLSFRIFRSRRHS